MITTEYNTYEEYAAANARKGLQVIPKSLWNDLKSCEEDV